MPAYIVTMTTIPESPGSVDDPMGTRNGVSDVTREAQRADDGVSPVVGKEGVSFHDDESDDAAGHPVRSILGCEGGLVIIERRGTP